MYCNRAAAIFIAVLASLALTGPVEAHEIKNVAEGFVSGLFHPLNGPDHMAAMVAVGLWGAFLGAPALWLLPIIFPLVMAVGGALGILGVTIPFVEAGIALSAITLGAMVAFALRPPIWTAGILVGLFAIFHGHAHGTELPDAENALAYSSGFVIATGLLHISGILFGLLTAYPMGLIAVRGCGVLIALVGLAFLLS